MGVTTLVVLLWSWGQAKVATAVLVAARCSYIQAPGAPSEKARKACVREMKKKLKDAKIPADLLAKANAL